MMVSGLGMRLELGEGFLTVKKVFDGGPVARANAEALEDDPHGSELVAEGDVLLGVGEQELAGLSEVAIRELLAALGPDGAELILEFAHRSVRASGPQLEQFSIVVQVQAGGDNVVEIDEGIEVVDLSAKSAKKSAREKREKEAQTLKSTLCSDFYSVNMQGH
jgi:hypothetical protein